MKVKQVTDKFKIYCTNEIEQWRADTFWTKEPETIEWIKSFYPNSVFIDVGANIGIYTLYALSLGHFVVSFEPHRKNYLRLLQNIQLNKFNQCLPLPCGVSDRNSIDNFYFDNEKIGSSGGQLLDNIGKNAVPVLIMQLDDLDIGINNNYYIKIDIDGREYDVINGLGDKIKKFNLKSVLVEINNNKELIVNRMHYHNFTHNNKFNKLKTHSRHRRAKEGIKAENVIFTRR